MLNHFQRYDFFLSRFGHNQIRSKVQFQVYKNEAQYSNEEHLRRKNNNNQTKPNQTYAHNFKLNRETFLGCCILKVSNQKWKPSFGIAAKSVYLKSFVGSSKLLDNYLSECVSFRARVELYR